MDMSDPEGEGTGDRTREGGGADPRAIPRRGRIAAAASFLSHWRGELRIAPLEIRADLDWKDLDVPALLATTPRAEVAGLRSARSGGPPTEVASGGAVPEDTAVAPAGARVKLKGAAKRPSSAREAPPQRR
jgi:hypothetical protein